MSFMQNQVTRKIRWIEVDSDAGTEWIPFENAKTSNPTASDVKDFIQGRKVYSVRVVDGYGARLSAPGYLDCTEWTVFDTEEEAEKYLLDTFGDDDSEE
jgi:hypothetical protein